MKRLFLLLCAAFALAACNDDNDGPSAGDENPYIEEGAYTGNMHFYGKCTSTPASSDGNTVTKPEAHFEFTDGVGGNATIYMHGLSFAEGMPGIEMRISDIPYTGSGKRLLLRADRIVPESNFTGDYKPYERFAISNFSGEVDNIFCRISFACNGYNVTFEGKLRIE